MYQFPLDKLSEIPTPYYYYDMALLRSTLDAVNKEIKGFPFKVHYAIKANGNDVILREIASHGFGADLVSGGELVAAMAAGFKAQDLAFSGVGKTDWEISLVVENDIFSFNVESVPELEVINEIAGGLRKKAGVVLRVNPDIDAHTHRYITTGTAHDKFGISLEMLPQVIQMAHNLPNIHLRGLHFHIGSQITMMRPYEMLCEKINELQDSLERMGVSLEIINVGGGLGVDYDAPDEHPLAGFTSYFNVFKRGLKLRQGQEVHFELGRSIMAQCGTLISRVVFVKSNRDKKFVILDAGMTDLIRPALYEAHHKIQNLTSSSPHHETYDVVGPVCESSDVFARDEVLPTTSRGDLIAIRSAGAYGESMSCRYNMRRLPQAHYSDAIAK